LQRGITAFALNTAAVPNNRAYRNYDIATWYRNFLRIAVL